jgi:hypothetical protein
MLRVLLAKDLLRAVRNPLPWLINLIVPLAMTALLGLVFGGSSNNAALGRIRFAVVDEDRSPLTDILRGAASQGRAGDHLDPVFLDRAAALKLVNANKISAVLIIRTNFTRNYLLGRKPVSLDLIKNPAESINPAVMEELLGVVVAGLNGISRNFHSDFPEWQRVFEGQGDYHNLSFLIDQTGDQIKSAGKFINPPLISYDNVESTNVADGGSAQSAISSRRNSAKADGNLVAPKPSEDGRQPAIFGYLLLGMSAMFLLFLGQNAMTDLHRELRLRTFERYQTLHQQLWPFVFGKIVFAVVILLLCNVIMLFGGGLVFGIHWHHPLPLAALAAAYSCFIAALFAALVAVVPDERRAGVLNNIAGMGLGLVGGCAFPPNQLPAFLRAHVTPQMPSFWFADTARNLQSAAGGVPWHFVLFKLLLCALILVTLAGLLFQRRFKSGLRV